MKRLLPIIVCIAIVVLFLARGDGSGPPTDEPEDTTPKRVPLPPLDPIDPIEEARGIYILKTAKAQFTLDLQSGRRFSFLSTFDGEKPRRATGTWSLTGSRLTLAYTHINDEPIENARWSRSITGTGPPSS